MEAFRNTFSGGMIKDIDARQQKNSTYTDLSNGTVTGNDDFYSVKPLAGNRMLGTLISEHDSGSTPNILYQAEGDIIYKAGTYAGQGEDEVNASVITFAVYPVNNTNKSVILFYDLVREELHTYYESTDASGLNLPPDGTIDGFVFKESDREHIYFVDDRNPPRKLTLEYDPADAPYSIRDISLIRYAPVDPVEVVSVGNKGILQSGTYQFSYRYYNTANLKRTKWSLLTNPVPIYPDNADIDEEEETAGGLPGEITSKSVKLSVDLTQDNAGYYDAIQLAVVKHVNGSKEPELTAFLTNVYTEWYNNPSSIIYDGTEREEEVQISDIVVDDAPIRSFKTIEEKDNRVVGGNIRYFDRVVDSADFQDAYTIKEPVGHEGVYKPLGNNNNNPSISLSPSFEYVNIKGFTGKTAYLKPYISDDTTIDLLFSGIALCGSNFGGTPPSLYVDDLVIDIGSDVVPGNQYRVQGVYYKTFFVRADGGTSDATESTTGTRQFANGGGGPGNEMFDVVYTAQPGDTAEDVARQLTEVIRTASGVVDGDVPVSRNGSTITVQNRTNGRVSDEGSFPCNNVFTRDAVVITTTTEKGNPISTSQDEQPDHVSGGYANPLNAYNRRGYFRDEVYRFGIVYQDIYGNWSPPVPLDFSQYNALVETGDTYTISGSQGNDNGMALIEVSGDQTRVFRPGDFVRMSGNDLAGTFLIMDVSYDAGNAVTVVGLDQPLDQATINNQGGVFHVKLGHEYSHASVGPDWKFPERRSKPYTLFGDASDVNKDDDDGVINALGLRIEGITNHPEWAVAMAVVRVRRIKDIAYQSPHIPSAAYQPTLNYQGGTDGCNNSGISFDGTYAPKMHSKGYAFHILRSNAYNAGGYDDADYEPVTGVAGRNVVPPMSFIIPPEYAYKYQGDPYQEFAFYKGGRVEVCDACTFFMTPPLPVPTPGNNDGTSHEDRQGFALRADGKFNYYYQRWQSKPDMINVDNYVNQFPAEDPKIKDSAPVQAASEYYTFPTYPITSYPIYRNINRYFDLDSVSRRNFGPSVNTQRGIVNLFTESFGDLTYLSVRQGTNLSNRNGYAKSIIFKDESLDYGRLYNPSLHGASNQVKSYTDGAVATTPIVNVRRGFDDERYGSIDKVHEYIFTGAYTPIQSPQEEIDIDVFGGDCFISKCNLKVNDSHVGIFDDNTLGCTGNTSNEQVRGYDDFAEVLSLYLETEVNASLGSDLFVYPKGDNTALSSFSNRFDYSYNFAYSLVNELKVWTSLDKLDQNRNDFGSRLVHSDVKLYQSIVEGFDRFRATSFYDMSATFGDITKLEKMTNDNIYVIQEEAVSVVPINENVIETSDGRQLAVSSDTLINRPQFLSTTNGSQHIRSVIKSQGTIFFADVKNREVYKVGGRANEPISAQGMYSEFLSMYDYDNPIPDASVIAGYDYNNDEYIIGQPMHQGSQWYYVWSDKIGAWMTRIDLLEGEQIIGLVHAKNNFYMTGLDYQGNVVMDERDTADRNGFMFGRSHETTLQCIVNPSVPNPVTFDVLVFDASDRLNRCSMEVYREDQRGVQVTDSMNLFREPREGSYRIPVLRDQSGARMRGKWAKLYATWENGEYNTTAVLTINNPANPPVISSVEVLGQEILGTTLSRGNYVSDEDFWQAVASAINNFQTTFEAVASGNQLNINVVDNTDSFYYNVAPNVTQAGDPVNIQAFTGQPYGDARLHSVITKYRPSHRLPTR